jgi:hypothetical protein
MTFGELESLADRKLKQLPLLGAPQTLLPRVLTAVQQWSTRPWYERAWFTWPAVWQMASVAGLILIVAGGNWLWQGMQPLAEGAVSALRPATADVAGVGQSVDLAITAARVVWHALLEPFIPYAFMLVALMSFVCAAVGTALNHVLSGRMVQP